MSQKTYTMKEVLSILKLIKSFTTEAVKDCKDGLKGGIHDGDWKECIGMEHRIDAYDFIGYQVDKLILKIKSDK